jgi:hypothetical protein
MKRVRRNGGSRSKLYSERIVVFCYCNSRWAVAEYPRLVIYAPGPVSRSEGGWLDNGRTTRGCRSARWTASPDGNPAEPMPLLSTKA